MRHFLFLSLILCFALLNSFQFQKFNGRRTFRIKDLLNDNNDADFLLMQKQIEELLSKNSDNDPTTDTNSVSSNLDQSDQSEDLRNPKRKIAFVSSLLGAAVFLLQGSQQVSGVALLKQMEKESVPLQVCNFLATNDHCHIHIDIYHQTALCNNKPTVVEFYADWCESCKELAPTVRALEFKYRDDINFVTINGVDPQNGR